MNDKTANQPRTVVDDTDFVDARVAPRGSLENLSQHEIAKLLDRGQGGLYPLLRRCALAVLASGNEIRDPRELFEKYHDFQLEVIRQPWGVKVEMLNAPGNAFVDGKMIRGAKEHLFAVLRDIVFVANEIIESERFDLSDSGGITNAVFCILRNAKLLDDKSDPDIVVCWGGHAVSGEEYDYSKKVGYELGLRGLNICTGCGPGVMKGPMKGAAIGHAKQRIHGGRYIGITEPGIIAAESPNAIVNQLVIMPDIEKRLEAFVRLGHGIIVFPGGVGTAEECLFLLGVLLDPANANHKFPLILTGPSSAADYFHRFHDFVGLTLGDEAQSRYEIIIDNPAEVAKVMSAGLENVRLHRLETGDAYNFNWTLSIPRDFQVPFEVSHASAKALTLQLDQPIHERAVNLRRMFSLLVAGSVKDYGIQQVEEHGPFEIHGDPELMGAIDSLLEQFVAQNRMKLSGNRQPVYRIKA